MFRGVATPISSLVQSTWRKEARPCGRACPQEGVVGGGGRELGVIDGDGAAVEGVGFVEAAGLGEEEGEVSEEQAEIGVVGALDLLADRDGAAEQGLGVGDEAELRVADGEVAGDSGYER